MSGRRANSPGDLARGSIQSLHPYSEEASTPIDLSANTNLFSPNPAIARVLSSVSPEELRSYPSLASEPLRAAIARKLRVDPEHVLVGNGSNDLIDCAIRAFANPGERVVYHPPTFEMIPVFALANAATPTPVELGPSFALDPSGIVAANGKITFLCRPNNPTGNAFPREAVLSLLDELSGIVVLDEAYVEFLGDTLRSEAMARDRVVVLRTFSKAHGLAGLRVGYAVGSPTALAEIAKVRGPFKVNTLSERIAVAALAEDGYVERVVRSVRIERARLASALSDLGFLVHESEANFLLLRPPVSPQRLCASLERDGITVRRFSGRLADHVRVTVPPREIGDLFLAAAQKAVGGG